MARAITGAAAAALRLAASSRPSISRFLLPAAPSVRPACLAPRVLLPADFSRWFAASKNRVVPSDIEDADNITDDDDIDLTDDFLSEDLDEIDEVDSADEDPSKDDSE